MPKITRAIANKKNFFPRKYNKITAAKTKRVIKKQNIAPKDLVKNNAAAKMVK